jgi:hypothetical protein
VLCYCIGLLLSLLVRGQSFETLRLPQDPKAEDVEHYLLELRRLIHQTDFESKLGKLEPANEAQMRKTVALQVKESVQLIPPSFAEVVLKQCAQVEADADSGKIKVLVRPVYAFEHPTGYVIRSYRTWFTRMAIAALADTTAEFPPDQQTIILGSLGQFPELVSVLVKHRWTQQVEPFLSTKLMKYIDQKTKWDDADYTWILYLIQLDSPRARECLEYLMVKANPGVMVKTYQAATQAQYKGLDLQVMLRKAWDEIKSSPYNEVYAPLAAENGITDAFVMIANRIRNKSISPYTRDYGRVLLELIRPPFDDPQLAAKEVLAHKKSLKFDPASGTFSLN